MLQKHNEKLYLLFFTILSWFQVSSGNGTVAFLFRRYYNPQQKLNDGDKCDGFFVGSSCEQIFKICLSFSSWKFDTCEVMKFESEQHFKTLHEFKEGDNLCQGDKTKIPILSKLQGRIPFQKELRQILLPGKQNKDNLHKGDQVTNPIISKFEGRFPGIIYVKVLIEDVDITSDYDVILAETKILRLDEKDRYFNYSVNNMYTDFDFSLKVNCEKYYYLADCSKYCKPNANSYCTSSGTLICHKNWYGETCERYCKETPKYFCSNHGYKFCNLGWYGPNCKQYAGDRKYGRK